MFVQDFVVNGQGHGPTGEVIAGCRYDPGMLRPFIETNPNHPHRGRPCVSINTGRMIWNEKAKKHIPERKTVLINELQARGIYSPVFNATSLRKEEWLQLDQVVLRAARLRLRAWADLAAANSFGGFNGMSKMILEWEQMSDPGSALMDMDGLSEGQTDNPVFQLQGLPLPITHSDFWFSSRRLAVSRNTGTPLDTTMGEAAGHRVAELVEKTTIGNDAGSSPFYFGGNSTQTGGYGYSSKVYGYTNFTNRLTNTALYAPTKNGRAGTGWVPGDTIKDVLGLRQTLYLNKFYGPFMLYHSNDWDQYMDNDYIVTAGAGGVSGLTTQTLRERLKSIENIMDVRRLDFLTAEKHTSNNPTSNTTFSTQYPDPAAIVNTNPFTLLLVQMTPDCARAVNGQDITTIQWESVGGMRLNFKVMCIQVPQLRSDFYGQCGIMHANASGGN